MVKAETDVIYGGRSALYKYIDMAPVIDEVTKMGGSLCLG